MKDCLNGLIIFAIFMVALVVVFGGFISFENHVGAAINLTVLFLAPFGAIFLDKE